MNQVQIQTLQFYKGNWKCKANGNTYSLKISDETVNLKLSDSNDKLISEVIFDNRPHWHENLLFYTTENNRFIIYGAEENYLTFGEHNERPNKYERIK